MLSIDRPLSDNQLILLCNEMKERANIVIADKEITFNESFKNSGHVIFWVPNGKQDVGHWVCAVRKPNNTCFFFDSFGRSPYHWHYLKKMFENSKLRYVEYNKTKFQFNNSNVCGKYCLVVIALNKMGLTYKQIEDFFSLSAMRLLSITII